MKILNIVLKVLIKYLNYLTDYKFKKINKFIILNIFLIERFVVTISYLFRSLLFNKIFIDLISFRSDYYFIQGEYILSKKIFNKVVSKFIVTGIKQADEISLDYRYLTSFGELSSQIDIFLKFNILNEKSLYNLKKKNKKFICYYNFSECSNLSFIKLWSNYIHFKNINLQPKNKKIFFINSRWLPCIGNDDQLIFEPYSTIYPHIQKQWNDIQKDCLIKVSEQIIKRSKKFFLLKYNIDIEKQKFVTTHINNFYKKNFDFHKIRTVKNEMNYMKTLNFLSLNNFMNIIISPKKTQLLSKYFLNISERVPSYISIYLLAKCDFFIGTASGPHMVPYIFNKNSIWTNMIPFESTPPLKKDIYILKKCFFNGAILFKELFKSLYIRHSSYYYKEKKIKVEDNTEEEIYRAVLEFLNPKLQNAILQSNFKKIRKKLTYHNYETNSKLSSYFIEKNFEKFI